MILLDRFDLCFIASSYPINLHFGGLAMTTELRSSAAALFRRAIATGLLAVAPALLAGPIAFNTWGQFAFADAGSAATGCDPADPAGGFCIPSSGTATIFLDAPAWTFAAPAGGAVLTLIDAFLSGDQFEVFDFGISIGLTSLPGQGIDCGDDPVVCLGTAGMSAGIFALAAGNHAITLVPTLSPEGGGSGYLLVTASVAEPGSLALLGLGIVGLGLARRNRRRS